MTIMRDPTTGWITTKKLGSLTESFSYNQFGEPTAITVTGPAGAVAVDHRAARPSRSDRRRTTTNRIDPPHRQLHLRRCGPMTAETDDGKKTSYGYDTAGNIVTVAGPSGTTKNTYDARNALLRSGSTDYTYDGSGRLATAKSPTGDHDLSLRRAGQPDRRGRRPGSRRWATRSDPLTAGWPAAAAGRPRRPWPTWTPSRPVATFTSSGAVDEVYVYDGDLQPTNINDGGGLLPAYLTKGGTTYLEVPDASGGPALAIDAGTRGDCRRGRPFGAGGHPFGDPPRVPAHRVRRRHR